ncbi:hypothetical protein HID58_065572 [Brassica napus]|uniref:Proteasome subunit beta n=3 Tax=Brassica TaxID=3705 RepID=A0ABQ7ZD90_BRANA|nr:hypothetical protein HID58_065572 [Brassica napus]
MSIFEYNGSAVVAMVGKNCFAIASDRRLGVQLQTIATDFQRISKIHDRVFIGLSGLATDVQTLYQRLVFRHKLYQLREERDMKPETFASLVSAILYEKRFGPYLCQPVIAGLGEDDKPFICTMDSIGAKELAKDFVVSGTASESLYGACEAMYKPDMEAEELFETISQALLSSVDRDCLSGWGGHVYVVGRVMDSFFTGFVHSLGNFFGSPLDFLSGKSCSTLCPSPWDVLCYVENFCVASLAKAALILIVAYLFLFFIYMLYKIGFWHCIIHGFFRFLWASVSCWFYILSNCCTFFCYDLLHTKRRRRRRNRRYSEDEDTDDGGSFRYHRSRREMRKEERLRKSLRPRSHRVRVGVRKDHPTFDLGLSQHAGGGPGGVGPVHGIRVSRESQFARKGSERRARCNENQLLYISISCLNFHVDILRIDNDWISHGVPTKPELQSHYQIPPSITPIIILLSILGTCLKI